MNRKTTTIIVTLAAALLFSTVGMASAVMIGDHNITFINHTYDGHNSTWCYNVTSGHQPALSHWVICWCNGSAIAGASEGYTFGTDPHTGITGIKFENGYGVDNKSKDVCFTLRGNYSEELIEVGTKAGNTNPGGDGNLDYGWVTGPADSDNCPGCIVPELSTLILVSVGLLTLVGYFTLRRKD